MIRINEDRGQMSEVGDQRSDVGGQRSGLRDSWMFTPLNRGPFEGLTGDGMLQCWDEWMG